jgi:serine-type D-Ala-D-Ala carboxypeptidase (penicillin-binding protein 5/6)
MELERRRGRWRWRGIFVPLGIGLLGQFCPADAAVGRRHHYAHHRSSIPMYHAELLMDADSGNILYAENSTMQWPPASMAKMMLMAVAEDEIRAGHFSYEDPVRISERAATTRGSRLGLHEGDVYPLGELMKAALIRSANDAAVAVAEKIAGSVEACVRKMNQKAQALRMEDTYYGTVDGLPPRPLHDIDHTTATDLAILARSIIRNTSLLRWTSMETAPFDGGRVILRNTNHLIGHLAGCDGLKTGFTIQAGFNLTATAMRSDMRLISVVLGAPSNPERFIQTARLLDWGFDNFTKVHLVTRGQSLPVHVQIQAGPSIQPVAESDVTLVMRKSELSKFRLEYSVPAVVQGPLANDTPLGQVIVLDGGEVVTRVDAVAAVAVAAAVQDVASPADRVAIDNRVTGPVATLPTQGVLAPAGSGISQENR